MERLKKWSIVVYEFIRYVGPPLVRRLWDIFLSAASWLRGLLPKTQCSKIKLVLYISGILGYIVVGILTIWGAMMLI
jgi:hypothetical protein